MTAHTTNCDEVEYYDEDTGEGNENVVTCKSKGCAKKRKVAPGAKQQVKKKRVSRVFWMSSAVMNHSCCR
jgi:hypothetical protein